MDSYVSTNNVREENGYIIVEFDERNDFDIKLVYTPLFFEILGIDDVEIKMIQGEGEANQTTKEDLILSANDVIENNMNKSNTSEQTGGGNDIPYQEYTDEEIPKLTVPYRYFVNILRLPSSAQETIKSSNWFSKFRFDINSDRKDEPELSENVKEDEPALSENVKEDEPELSENVKEDENDDVQNMKVYKEESESQIKKMTERLIIKIKKTGESELETLSQYLEKKRSGKRTIYTYEDSGFTYQQKEKLQEDLEKQYEFMKLHDFMFLNPSIEKIYYLNDTFVILDSGSISKMDENITKNQWLSAIITIL